MVQAVFKLPCKNIYTARIVNFLPSNIYTDSQSHKKNVKGNLNNQQCRVIFYQEKKNLFAFLLTSQETVESQLAAPLIHTCYFGDALQFRNWKSDN